MIEEYDPSAFPPFAVTVDIAVLTIRRGRLHVLLIQRGVEPFAGMWALPGGFVTPDESAHEAAQRELAEEAFVGNDIHLEQLATYSEPGRDPRMRVVSVAHVALAPNLPEPKAGSDATRARWYPTDEVSDLAFDHDVILADALRRVRSKLEYTTLATSFLSPAFTIGELRAVYSAVWGAEVPAANFRRKVLATPGFVTPVADFRAGVPGPKAQLYMAGDAGEIVPAFNRNAMTRAQ